MYDGYAFFSIWVKWKLEKNDRKILSQMYDQVYVFPINYYTDTEKTLKFLKNTFVLSPLNYPGQRVHFPKNLKIPYHGIKHN